jgi:hypothetical protein
MTGPLIVPPRVAVDQTAGQGPFLRGACGQGRGERGDNEASGGSGNTGLNQPLPAAWCRCDRRASRFTPAKNWPYRLTRARARARCRNFCSESGVPTWIN